MKNKLIKQRSEILRLLPFLLGLGVLTYTWSMIFSPEYIATLKHQIALFLFFVNVAVYFFKFNYGIYFTGLIFLLATFNIIAIYPDITTSSYFIKIGNTELATPSVQIKSLILLVVFIVFNGGYLFEKYADFKYGKKEKDSV